MTGKGGFTSAPKRRLQWMLGAQVLWLVLVCLIGGWWSRLLLKQADRIAELEASAGVAAHVSQEQILKTQRMLFWEGGTYFLLLAGSSAVLFWLYWRDVRRVRGIQAFFASVTHELRTPLTSIRLQAESIAENLSGDREQKELVERLLEDTMRLEGQVERTLELARVEGGGAIYPEATELKPWLERLVSAWRDAYRDRILFELSVDDVSAVADPTALQVVMKNLVENSIRHSKASPVRIRVGVRREGDGVLLSFKDNGGRFEGNTSTLGKIFEKGASSQGAGVGLYLIRVLMDQMGGTVEFKAAEGFEVVLRLAATTEGGAHGR